MNLSEQIEKAMIGTDNPDEATFLQTAVPQWLLQSWRDKAKELEDKHEGHAPNAMSLRDGNVQVPIKQWEEKDKKTHELEKELARRDALLKVKERAVKKYKGLFEAWEKDHDQKYCYHEDPDNTGRCIKCQIDMEDVDWDEIARWEAQQWAVRYKSMAQSEAENSADHLTSETGVTWKAVPLAVKEEGPWVVLVLDKELIPGYWTGLEVAGPLIGAVHQAKSMSYPAARRRADVLSKRDGRTAIPIRLFDVKEDTNG